MEVEAIVPVSFAKWEGEMPEYISEDMFTGSFKHYRECIEELNKDPFKRKKRAQILGKCCNNCIDYEWHTTICKRYWCEMDPRSVCSQYSKEAIPV